MRRLSDLLTALEHPVAEDRVRLAWAAVTGNLALAPLLSGPAPRRLIPATALRNWIAEETGMPMWLIEASRKATGELIEALALLLPLPGHPNDPDLAQILADLKSLPPGSLARGPVLAMARRLSPRSRVLYFRLITGTYRPPFSRAALFGPAAGEDGPQSMVHERPQPILAVMIYAEAALATGAKGPEITLAVRDGNQLVPIVRARSALSDDQTTALMTWIRSAATARFGPLRAVPARQVFSLEYATLTANRRRKSGLTLTDPRIIDWHPDRDLSEATQLADLTARLPNTA